MRKALDAGSEFWGAALWNWGYVAMFGILGVGYRRFLYPGTGANQGFSSSYAMHSGAEWQAGKEYPLVAFFSSRIFFTLLAMGVFLLPPYYYWLLSWPSRSRPAAGSHAERLKNHLLSTAIGVLIGAGMYVLYVAFASEAERVRLSEGAFGVWAPLVGYFVAQVVFGLLVAWPFACLAVSDKRVAAGRKSKSP